MKPVLILQYILQTIFVFWHYSFYITTQYGYSLESNISDEMLGNIPKLDVISKEWNVYTYFIRMLGMLVISKGFHSKTWTAKVHAVFIFQIKFMKETHIQFIHLPVLLQFYFYDKIVGSIILYIYSDVYLFRDNIKMLMILYEWDIQI